MATMPLTGLSTRTRIPSYRDAVQSEQQCHGVFQSELNAFFSLVGEATQQIKHLSISVQFGSNRLNLFHDGIETVNEEVGLLYPLAYNASAMLVDLVSEKFPNLISLHLDGPFPAHAFTKLGKFSKQLSELGVDPFHKNCLFVPAALKQLQGTYSLSFHKHHLIPHPFSLPNLRDAHITHLQNNSVVQNSVSLFAILPVVLKYLDLGNIQVDPPESCPIGLESVSCKSCSLRSMVSILGMTENLSNFSTGVLTVLSETVEEWNYLADRIAKGLSGVSSIQLVDDPYNPLCKFLSQVRQLSTIVTVILESAEVDDEVLKEIKKVFPSMQCLHWVKDSM